MLAGSLVLLAALWPGPSVDAAPSPPLAAHATPRVYSGAIPFEARVTTVSTMLGVPPTFVDGVVDGLDLLYHRRYKDCRAWFTSLEEAFPGTGVSPVAELLVWQSVMLENFDFRYDDPYRAASALARVKLGEAGKKPGAEAWEELMMTVVSGIEAIHAARQDRYLAALSLAFEAVDHVERTRRAAPAFVDLHLADGLYNYWRTVVTQRVKGMPDFGDKKAEGIAQIQDVVSHGIFLRPPARLSMAFTWLEEKQHGKAIEALEANRAEYPENVINELMLGLARLQAKDDAGAMAAFDRVLQLDPASRRVHYYRGVVHARRGEHAHAEAEMRAYLAFDQLEPYHVSGAWYRLGQALYAQKRYADAYAAYETAVKTDGDAPSKAALERMKKARKDGTIAW